ncbi:hypothetical protein PA7559_23840 [Pseudoalteromonas distincta]
MRGVSQKFFKSSDGSNSPAVHVGSSLTGGVNKGVVVVSMVLPPPQPTKEEPNSTVIMASDILLFLSMLSTFCK